MLDDFTALLDDLLFYLQIVAVILMFQAIVLAVVGTLIITRLIPMVEITMNNAKPAAWRDCPIFKPTPNQPNPPLGWGQQRRRAPTLPRPRGLDAHDRVARPIMAGRSR